MTEPKDPDATRESKGRGDLPHSHRDAGLGVYTMWTRPPTGKILIVDPDPDIARMLEVRLAREGHVVMVADSAHGALGLVESERPDIALLDRSAGDMNGVDLLKTLKSSLEPFEAILMSVDPTTELSIQAYDAGAFDVLEKPFPHLKIVTAKVRNAVAKVLAERDRGKLARMLHAQTQDLVHREQEAEKGSTGDLAPEIDLDLDLESISGVDPLTGLPNRRASDERFGKEAARALRYDRPLCVALASVDALESVVERFGSKVSDGVLRGIVAMFNSMIRDVDFLARRQGGEFVFIFPETPKDSGYNVVERIRQKLSETSFSEYVEAEGNSVEFKLSASFGVAGLPNDSMNAEILRTAAEAALSRAKASGDTVVLFERAMLPTA